MAESKETIIEISLGGKRVLLKRGSEAIAMNINGKSVHIWATHHDGAWTVAELKFLEDEVVPKWKTI